MGLTITGCKATPSSITVFFSGDIKIYLKKPSTITVYDPASSPSLGSGPAVPPEVTYDPIHYSLMVDPTKLKNPITINPGDNIMVSVTGIDSGTLAIATHVNGDGGEVAKRQAREVTESVEDAVAYPVLTEAVSFPPSGGAAAPTTVVGPAPAAGAALGQTVARAVSDVLGWKANAADPKGFIGALSQAFTLTEVEGHTEAAWNPRTYAVQTDMGGGITGAQASLYTRAKDALDQSLPLLDGLYPLDPDADPEYVKALREMARSQMNEIVKELGTLGGPSILRVNTYFTILLGPQNITFAPGSAPTTFDPDQIQGTLGTLRDTYGIYFKNNPFSNSIEDEQDITNFRVISDYMTSLLQTWISNGQFFILGTKLPNFFGTQLVLLSRQYSVIVETVNEVRFALDSVFIGRAERQALLLEFAKFPPMFLEDLLREIEDHATDEGPRLLQDGGRISVRNNILPIVRNYVELVQQAHKPTNLKSLPDGYRTVRVQRALDDLHDQLKALIVLAIPVEQQVPPPLEEPESRLQVLNVSPNSITSPGAVVHVPVPGAVAHVAVPVTIMGTGFKNGARASLSELLGVSIGPTTFLSENLLVATVTVTPDASGTCDVTVTNLDGTSNTLLNGLSVSPAE